MYIELNPVLLTLIALLVTLLASAFVRWASIRGWLLLSVLLLVCAGTNPNKADHVTVVRQAAGAQRVADVFSDTFEALAVYQSCGLASMLVIDGRVLSFGVLGQVWVMKINPLARSIRL